MASTKLTVSSPPSISARPERASAKLHEALASEADIGRLGEFVHQLLEILEGLGGILFGDVELAEFIQGDVPG
jgi:hypothetical protein